MRCAKRSAMRQRLAQVAESLLKTIDNLIATDTEPPGRARGLLMAMDRKLSQGIQQFIDAADLLGA